MKYSEKLLFVQASMEIGKAFEDPFGGSGGGKEWSMITAFLHLLQGRNLQNLYHSLIGLLILILRS